MRWTVIGGDQHVEIAIIIKIAECRAAADLWLREIRTGFRRYIVKSGTPAVQKQMGRLLIARISPEIAHGVINVAVHHQQVQQSIQVRIKKEAAKSQAALR